MSRARRFAVQGMSDVLGAEQLRVESLREGGTQRLAAVTGEQFVQLLDIAHPPLGPSVHDLGEEISAASPVSNRCWRLR